MIFDAAEMDRSLFERTFDVCVVGAGPAGITLARKLAAAGAEVALMEAGGLEITEESQDVYRGTNLGMEYFDLDVARLRYFGGTSNHWGGWCRALDWDDFNHRAVHPLSGWPIDRVDLDPYQPETDDILDLVAESEAPDLPMRQAGHDFHRFQFRWSPPTRFAEKYLDEIDGSDRIRLVLNANLVDLRLGDDLGTVAGAVFRNYDAADPGFTVKARAYALCTGGIENARLLLNFRSQVPDGIGNAAGMVGRCFCDHPHFVIADVMLRVLVTEREFYAPTELLMLREKCLGYGLRLEPGWIEPDGLVSLIRREVPPETFAILLSERVHDSVTDPLPGLHPEVSLEGAQTAVFRTAFEQQQNLESRVLLGEERDAFGLRRVALDWRLTDLDIHTMRTAALTFARHIAEEDIGRAQIRPWLMQEPPAFPGIADDEVGGKHHMCTTRMSDDPKTGVVDADCRVHGIANLFIGGSSVFATTGHCNPTYTITQLALRLGDHLTDWLAG